MTATRACRRWREALWREVDGVSTPAGARRLEAHLAQCPACRLAHEAARSLDTALASSPAASLAEDFQQRVMLGLAAGLRGTPSSRSGPDRQRYSGEAADWWVLLGGLGVALLVVVLSIAALSRITLKAVSYAGSSPSNAASALTQGLLRGVQQGFSTTGEAFMGLLHSPLALALTLTGGIVAVTLGWVGLFLSRSSAS